MGAGRFTGAKRQRLKENAIATFQAPPWCPSPLTTFFRLMMTGAALSPDALISTTFYLTRHQAYPTACYRWLNE